MTPATLIIQALGLAGIVTLLHGLMLWEGASLRQWIVQLTRRRKPKPKKHRSRHSDHAMRYMIVGIYAMGLTAIAHILYERLCNDDKYAIGLVVPLMFLIQIWIMGLYHLEKSRRLEQQLPRLALKDTESNQGWPALLATVPGFVIVFIPLGMLLIYGAIVIAISMFYALYYHSQQGNAQ